MSSGFYDIDPSLENYWRGVILFGRNVASYKFALAKSLLELANNKSDFIALEDLAEPFSRHIVEHVKSGHKQATSSSSRFLKACEQYGQGDITHDKLIGTTTQLGFANAVARSGIGHVRIHDLRHTAAVAMLSEEVPLEKVSEMLDHSKMAVTFSTCAGFLPQHMQDAVDVLDFASLKRGA